MISHNNVNFIWDTATEELWTLSSQEQKSMQVRLFSQHLGLRKEVCIDLLWKSLDEKNTSKWYNTRGMNTKGQRIPQMDVRDSKKAGE